MFVIYTTSFSAGLLRQVPQSKAFYARSHQSYWGTRGRVAIACLSSTLK